MSVTVRVLEIGTTPNNNPPIKVHLKMPLGHAIEWIQYMMGIQPIQILKEDKIDIEFIEIRPLNVYIETTLPLQLQPYVSIIKNSLKFASIYDFIDNKLDYIK
jgi:hypothetical protein